MYARAQWLQIPNQNLKYSDIFGAYTKYGQDAYRDDDPNQKPEWL